MRIEAYTQVQQLYSAKGVGKVQKSAGVSASDQLQLSSTGKDYQTAKAAVKTAPDIREDLVASIKASMEAGTYQVSGESFADKLIAKYDEMR